MTSTFRRLRTALNSERLLTALAVAAGVWFIAEAVGAALPARDVATTVRPGDRIDLTELALAGGAPTLLIALQEDCRWCDESAAFYRDLLTSNATGALRIAVLVPYSADAGRSQVDRYGLGDVEVRQADFADLKIAGTPSILLVGPNGYLKKAWLGRLSTSAEAAVFATAGLVRIARTAEARRGDGRESLSASALVAVLRTPGAGVIDTRMRDEFRLAHIVGAVNIPADELYARLKYEWPIDHELAIYCERATTCAVYLGEEQPLDGECEQAADVATAAGVRRVRIIEGLLDEVAAAGVAVRRQ